MSNIPDFPSVAPPSYNSYGDGRRFAARRTEFEGNVISTRRRAGKARRTFRVGWSSLSDADYVLIASFFETWQGQAFNFTPPGEANPVLCIFDEDEIEGVAVAPDVDGTARWRLTVRLSECVDSELLINAAEEEQEVEP